MADWLWKSPPAEAWLRFGTSHHLTNTRSLLYHRLNVCRLKHDRSVEAIWGRLCSALIFFFFFFLPSKAWARSLNEQEIVRRCRRHVCTVKAGSTLWKWLNSPWLRDKASVLCVLLNFTAHFMENVQWINKCSLCKSEEGRVKRAKETKCFIQLI